MVYSEVYAGTPSATIPDLTGKIINKGKLRLVKIIGRGSWGVVYYAESVQDPKKRYAVKVVNPETMDYEQRSRIADEVNLQELASVSSEHVLRIINVIEDRDLRLLFILTEFCEGGDLLTYAGSFKSNEQIKSIFLQILDAVEACHKSGVYHRDLKLENIMCKDVECKNIVLGDFGFATTNKTHQSFGMGSEPFMSPELRGVFTDVKRINSASTDIWALGVILMVLITGEQPWVKASVSDAYFKEYFLRDSDMLYKDFPISRAANELVKSMFAIDPRERITITELRARTLEVKSFISHRKPSDYKLGNEHCVSGDGSLPATRGAYTFPEVPRVVDPAPTTEADITDYNSDMEPDSDSESDTDSDGPITPETHAVDEAATVNDQLEALDDLAELDLGTAVASMHLTPKEKKCASQEQNAPEGEKFDTLEESKPEKRVLWSAARVVGVQTRYTKTH